MNYKAFTALILSTICLSAQAEQRWFEVELLLFQRNVDIDNISEQLSSNELQVDTQQSINFLKADKPDNCVQPTDCFSKANPTVIDNAHFNRDNGFVKLPNSALQLTPQRKRLSSHAGFNPIFHMAWRMPVVSGRRAIPIHLFAGENFAQKMQQLKLNKEAEATHQQLVAETSKEVDGNSVEQMINKPDESVGTEQITADINQTNSTVTGADITPAVNNQAIDKWAVDGNFKVYLDHYLYIDSQLILRKEVTEEVAAITQPVEVIDDVNGVQIATHLNDEVTPEVKLETSIKEVLFDQNRRLRSEEIHYLDHPLFGMIVQIRKIPAKTE